MSSRGVLPCVELESGSPALYSVIWLHGLGADGHDFEPIVPHLGLGGEIGVRFVFPHAPAIPVTLNMGMVMPSWYDIMEVDLGRRQDEEGILRSTSRIRALIGRENARGIPAHRIVLAGFSQGGAIALHTGLRYEESLAGILVLSTYLLRQESLEAERSQANLKTPMFQAHGRYDPMVPMDRGLHCRDRLLALGYDLEWRDYPIQHEVCLEEIQAAGRWLERRLVP